MQSGGRPVVDTPPPPFTPAAVSRAPPIVFRTLFDRLRHCHAGGRRRLRRRGTTGSGGGSGARGWRSLIAINDASTLNDFEIYIGEVNDAYEDSALRTHLFAAGLADHRPSWAMDGAPLLLPHQDLIHLRTERNRRLIQTSSTKSARIKVPAKGFQWSHTCEA
ncbi:unnamed protein product [Musa acuminata subsp. malaccensis]|uniref:(wild Malaysian banana) hypothetical protein n=1 Tax=Musa acuminata subsp. malaccensis TaxID=214687 RepID=A0A804I7F9_MUSAM|nr:unnamed protein product [Musa acuminata subsp. malaccensis]